MIAATSGGLGDIVYSIPVLKKLGVKTLFVKESYYFPPYGSLYLSSKRLIEQQGIAVKPTSGEYPPCKYQPDLKFDFDLDRARRQPSRGKNHIIVSYLNQFRLSHDDWKLPWLSIDGERILSHEYVVIQRTNRWRTNSLVNWKQVIENIKDVQPVFVGFRYEYEEFCKEIGRPLLYVKSTDILDMAVLIKHSDALYSNQSVSLTIAQGLGKKYYLERNPGKTNCLMYTENENLL